eukprot:jgi/Ulvmu1/1889/UM012_0046.1
MFSPLILAELPWGVAVTLAICIREAYVRYYLGDRRVEQVAAQVAVDGGAAFDDDTNEDEDEHMWPAAPGAAGPQRVAAGVHDTVWAAIMSGDAERMVTVLARDPSQALAQHPASDHRDSPVLRTLAARAASVDADSRWANMLVLLWGAAHAVGRQVEMRRDLEGAVLDARGGNHWRLRRAMIDALLAL